MEDNIYYKLREQMDQYSVGFPASKSGVEIKILKKFFTEDEVEIYLGLGPMPEPVETVSKRLNRNAEELSENLEKMVQKGTVFKNREENKLLYSAAPWMHGIAENAAGNLDQELAELCEQYCEETYVDHVLTLPTTSFMRFIPVGQSLEATASVAPYNRAEEYFKSKKKIAVIKCFCRDQLDVIGKGCGHPLETCFMFDWVADYVVERKQGRYLSLEEALELQRRCEEAGLVTFPTNLQNPFAMCHCCGCSCLNFRSLKKHDKPAEMVVHDFYAAVDRDECNGCEACFERCPIEAITINQNGIAEINLDRCIGCGMCVTTCPEEALRLVEKPEEDKQRKPVNPLEFSTELSNARGFSVSPAYHDEE